MNLLYIIGSGSVHYNEELRYSLRTVEAHCTDVEKITIVGERVSFLSEDVEFHKITEAEGNKEYRIAMKIYNACKAGYITGDFAFMNDDFFFTGLYDWTKNYAKPELKSNGFNHYQKAINDTKEYLLSLGCSTYHFDVHTPIIYNAEKFIDLLPHIRKSQLTSNGMTVKSLYGNIYNLTPTWYEDCKLSTLQTPRDWERIRQTPVISCSDGCWRNGMRAYLKKTYPNKSKYEQ